MLATNPLQISPLWIRLNVSLPRRSSKYPSCSAVGISVVSAALAAANVGEVVHAMHDLTEGGLAMGLFELVAPAGLGLRVKCGWR